MVITLKDGSEQLISRSKFTANLRHQSLVLIRYQFPVVSGLAVTIHRVQSATLDNASMAINESLFSEGHAYVACFMKK